jgi:CheY-like chemotaxis protein
VLRSVRSTLARADGRSIKIVLMRMMMLAVKRLRSHSRHPRTPRTRRLPIIAVTARNTDGGRERWLGAGATDFLPKPIESWALRTAIAASLASRELESLEN